MAFNASRLISTPQITPKASPHQLKSPSSRSSPTRAFKNEQLLNLKQVIGTTATSNNGFVALPDSSTFAYIAGSGAVLASLTDDNQVSQRFFRAKPSAAPFNAPLSIYDSPTPAAPAQVIRARAAASLRESSFGLPGSPSNDYNDSPGAKSAARARAATSVALSQDGRLLALGETGYKPRVLVFSTLKDASPDVPLTVMSEHTFGVRCLAFSPDSQYLASLGDMNDGFLYIWSINQRACSAALHASNKCTTNVKQITWMGNSLITVGTRHVKIWRIEDSVPEKVSPNKRTSDISFAYQSPGSKALAGRNCLLGSLLDKTFTSVAVVSRTKAIVCSEQGDVCILDDGQNPPKFYRVADVGFPVRTVAVNKSNQAIFAGLEGQLRSLQVLPLLDSQPTWAAEHLCRVELSGNDDSKSQGTLALAFLRDRLIMIDNQRSLKVLNLVDNQHNKGSYTVSHRFAAHGSAVLGIQAIVKSEADISSFITWSADGALLFWTAGGDCEHELKLELEQTNQSTEGFTNELKIARAFKQGQFVATGDKFGILRVTRVENNEGIFETRAHSNEITDISIREKDGAVHIATAARDRVIQLFHLRDTAWEHLQTIEEHNGAVTGLSFSEDGSRLVSCSSDRTVLIMEAVFAAKGSADIAGFLPTRPLILKATPLSVCPIAGGMLLISTIDRNIHRYDISTGNLISTFRASDQDGGDAVVMSSLVHFNKSKRSNLIAGVSGSDKSIRVYDESGKLLEREFGHTEGMTGITVVSESQSQGVQTLVTVATDGTIFIWELSSGEDQLSDLLGNLEISGESARSSQLFANRPPLRKVISSSELSRLHGLREEPEADTEQETLQPTSVSATDRPTPGKRLSRLSMTQTPKFDPTVGRVAPSAVDSTTSERAGRRASTIGRLSPENGRRYSQTARSVSRAPLPPPPKTTKSLRKSLSSSNLGDDSCRSLSISTDGVCRNLHSFREKMMQNDNIISVEEARELEKELSLTARVLAEKSKRKETAVAQLLDQYSERFLELIEGRIEKSVERQIKEKGRPVEDCSDCSDYGSGQMHSVALPDSGPKINETTIIEE